MMYSCEQCGNEFYVEDDWGYQQGNAMFCTYKCMRKYEKLHPVVFGRKGGGGNHNSTGQKSFTDEKKAEIRKAILDNLALPKKERLNAEKVAAKINVSRSTIQVYTRKIVKEQSNGK